MMRIAACVSAQLLIGVFFSFVGFMKAFAPIAELAQHHAWTVFLPAGLGRAIGWSEMACAAVLIAAIVLPLNRAAFASAFILIINQAIAASVHLTHGEVGALPQNAVLIALLGFIAWQRHELINKERRNDRA